jgi:hypothetical protein
MPHSHERILMTTWNGKTYPLALCFPPLAVADREALRADIARQGLSRPITLDHNGTLVDGIARQEICDELGIQPTYDVLPADVDRDAFIITANSHRLSSTQREQMAAGLLECPPRAVVRR